MLKWISWHRSVAVAFIFVLATGCNEYQIGAGEDIVAQVGGRTITVREFQLNYEFGFSTLKKAPDRKLSYLESMIDELLLSLEGYRLGLDQTERVQNLEAQLLQELLIEELLYTEVSESITVSDQEIRDAITRSKVQWKFRYWAEADLAAADHVYNMMKEQGYANVIAERLNKEEVLRDPKDFETNYLTWLETPPELLDAIKDLQIGEISQPIELNNVYFMIQMIDIRRDALAEYDYQSTSDRFKQILFQRKLKSATSQYVTKFMTAKNVVVKGEAFQILAEALLDWKGEMDNTRTLSDAIENASESEPALRKFNQQSEKILVTFSGGRWSLKDFIEHVDTGRLEIKPEKTERFRANLKREIGLTIRNELLAKEATANGLHKSEVVQNLLRAWRDKWVYQEVRRQYVLESGLEPSIVELEVPAGSEADIDRKTSFLQQEIGSLRKKNTVQIFEAALDSVSVTDFDKSRWATVFLFKNSSKRLAIPTVDPALGF